MDDQDKTNQITDDAQIKSDTSDTSVSQSISEPENTDTQTNRDTETPISSDDSDIDSPEVNMSDTPVADADADAEEVATDEATEESGDQMKSDTSEESENQEVSEPESQPDSEQVGMTDEAPSDTTDSAETTEEPISSDVSDSPAPAPQQGRWYVVHTYSGHENKVATQLMQRVESEHLENKIFEVLVPTQDKIEIRGGKKASVKEKIFPGYILVRMELDDLSWLAVRTTQGVTSFVGIGNRPTPVPAHEVASIVQFMSQGASPTFKDVFMVDDTVKIIDGPFAEFIGKVESVDKEKGKVRILVSIFGRETPVELDFLQVTKL